MPWVRFSDNRLRVARVLPFEPHCIHHDPPVDVVFHDLPFVVYIKGDSFILTMMNSGQGDKATTILNQLLSNSIAVLMVLQRIGWEEVNSFGALKERDVDSSSRFTEELSVCCQKASLKAEKL